jgi:hypothetical protein
MPRSEADATRETWKRYGYSDTDVDEMEDAEEIQQNTAPSNPTLRTFRSLCHRSRAATRGQTICSET